MSDKKKITERLELAYLELQEYAKSCAKVDKELENCLTYVKTELDKFKANGSKLSLLS